MSGHHSPIPPTHSPLTLHPSNEIQPWNKMMFLQSSYRNYTTPHDTSLAHHLQPYFKLPMVRFSRITAHLLHGFIVTKLKGLLQRLHNLEQQPPLEPLWTFKWNKLNNFQLVRWQKPAKKELKTLKTTKDLSNCNNSSAKCQPKKWKHTHSTLQSCNYSTANGQMRPCTKLHFFIFKSTTIILL